MASLLRPVCALGCRISQRKRPGKSRLFIASLCNNAAETACVREYSSRGAAERINWPQSCFRNGLNNRKGEMSVLQREMCEIHTVR